jgi:biofilm PGA synthesis protein PgaD
MKPLVIDTPSLQSLRQKYFSTAVTFVFWVVWIFLWTPLVTLLGWFLGIDQVYIQMIELDGYKEVIDDLLLFLECVAGMGGSLAVWALYNFGRFRNVERRTSLPPVSNAQLADFFHVDVATLSQQQTVQCLSVSFDDDGNITASQALMPNAAKQT